MDNTFQKLGYMVVEADHPGWLNYIRDLVHKDLHPFSDHTEVAACLNRSPHPGISPREVNALRLQMTQALTDADIGVRIFAAFHETLTALIGPDVLQQKNANLVIQQPGDTNVAPTHRDAPLNSPFEVVVWIPLTDSYRTKSMYILTKEDTEAALIYLKEEGFASYVHYAETFGMPLEVPFGSACLFWTGLVHHIPVNQEKETRWGVNHRFKSFFAPPGAKGNGYMKPLHLGTLTTLGMER